MRKFLVLIPIVMIGGFAIHHARSQPRPSTEVVTRAVELPVPPPVVEIPAIPEIPAVPTIVAVPATSGIAAHVTPGAELSVRIPRQAILDAQRLASQIRVHAQASAHADIEATLQGVMQVLDESLSETDIALEGAFEELGISASILAELAASIEASLQIETGEGERVKVVVPGKRRQQH